MKTSSMINHPSEYAAHVSGLPAQDHKGNHSKNCKQERLLPQAQEAMLPPPGQDLLSWSLGGQGRDLGRSSGLSQCY